MSAAGQGGASLPPSLQRKFARLETIDQDVWNRDPLTTLSATNTPQTRRHLRTLIERALVASHERYLQHTEPIVSSIEETQASLDALQALCERMQHTLSTRQGEVGRVLDEIQGLERGIQLTEARKGWLREYETKYQLPAETSQVLQRGVIDEAFFEALKRVQVVYANCRSLGGGLKLVEQLSSLQEEAFRHVCSWIQSACQRIERPEDAQSLQITEMMPKAMKSLRVRPPLYSYCAGEIAIARKTAVFQKYIQALSQGPRPIEMHRGDPWRYANDMLAWIHASIAGEMELVGVMFEGCYGGRNGRGGAAGEVLRTESYEVVEREERETGTASYPTPADNKHVTLQEIMDTIFEGVCRPLKLRLDQILLGAPSPVLNFQLITLFSFYMKTVAPVMGRGSHLSETLRGCRAAAEKALKDQMRQRGERLVRHVVVPGADLGWVSGEGWDDRLEVAVSIVKFYEGSFLVGGSGNKDAEVDGGDDEDDNAVEVTETTEATEAIDAIDVDDLLEAIVSPLVDAVVASSDALDPTSSVRLDDSGSTMNPANQHVYILNCLCHIRSRVGVYDSASGLCDRLTARIEDAARTLIVTQIASLLNGTGLDVDSANFGSGTDGAEAVAAAALALWNKLKAASDARTFVIVPDKIVDSSVRERIWEEVATCVLDAYVSAYHRCAATEGMGGKLARPEEIESLLAKAR